MKGFGKDIASAVAEKGHYVGDCKANVPLNLVKGMQD